MTQLQRRPMSLALRTVDLPPEMLAFVKEGTPKSPAVAKDDLTSPPVQQTEKIEAGGEITATPERPTRARAPKMRSAESPSADFPVGLVSLSIRVPLEITEGLVRASADRKIKRLRPCTQQEIVTEAIHRWLHQNGYSN